MRLKITMECQERQSIDINYNYYLSSLIYKLLRKSNKDYSTFLHQEGYEVNNKKYKMFTFSQLKPENYKIECGKITMEGRVTWYISSPIKEFLVYLISELASYPDIRIENEMFSIVNIETLMEPKYQSEMEFKCLSPITMSTAYLDENNKLKPIMLYLEDKRYIENLVKNIISKYKLLYGCNPGDPEFNIKFINIEKHKRGKLISYKDNIKIKGYMAPLKITGNPELIKVAYECGLGSKNSAGMGMIEVFEGR